MRNMNMTQGLSFGGNPPTPAPRDGKLFFHGELIFREIPKEKVPATAEPLVDTDTRYAQYPNAHVLAHSESGHHHVLIGGDDTAVLADPARDKVLNPRYIRVGDAPARVDHAKEGATTHGAYALHPGSTYEVRNAREYTPQGLRRSAD